MQKFLAVIKTVQPQPGTILGWGKWL